MKEGDGLPLYQKYYEFMVCSRLVPTADRVFAFSTCVHTNHADTLQGIDENGYFKSQQAEAYTPYLADDVAILCTALLVPPDQTPAAQPDFSQEARPPVPPPYLSKVSPAERLSVMEAIHDALVAYDGEWSPSFDAALANDVTGMRSVDFAADWKAANAAHDATHNCGNDSPYQCSRA